MGSPSDRFWVVKCVTKDGKTGFVYDVRDGFFFVPKYTTKQKALKRNRFFFNSRCVGKYVLKRSRRDKIEKFEWDINERNRTPHAKAMRKRHAEVAKAAAEYLRKKHREKDSAASKRKKRVISEGKQA